MTKKVNFSTRSQLIRGSLRYLLIADMLFYMVLCICIEIFECFGTERRQ